MPKNMSLNVASIHNTKKGGASVDKISLGNRIKTARLEKGYTQNTLAQCAGVSNVYLGEIERGLKMPSLNSFIKIIQALDISADYILRDEVASGERYVYDELADKMRDLTPKQRKTATDILDGYLKNL